MPRFSRLVYLVISIVTGTVFLYSAYTKLVPIQAFEYTMVDVIHLPHMVAAIGARFFVGLEAGLGGLIFLQIFGWRKWVLKSAFALLVFFSIYLVWLWIKVGNNVNCGCFGDSIWMSPSASLIKNAVLLFLTWVLIRKYPGFSYKWLAYAVPILVVITLVLPYIIFPIFKRYKMDFGPIYAADNVFAPSTDLRHGKHIIAFLSPSCIHCRRAGLKMHHIRESDASIPFYMIIGGTTSSLNDFWRDSHAQDITYTRLVQEPFMKYTHGVFPTIFWVNDGYVEAETGYTELNQAVIEKWMKSQ